MFYLSPATKPSQFRKIKGLLLTLFEQYPLQTTESEKTTKSSVQRNPAPILSQNMQGVEWVDLHSAEGRICALPCGLFPPCTPLIQKGEKVTAEKASLLEKASNVYGMKGNKIQVLKKENEE